MYGLDLLINDTESNVTTLKDILDKRGKSYNRDKYEASHVRMEAQDFDMQSVQSRESKRRRKKDGLNQTMRESSHHLGKIISDSKSRDRSLTTRNARDANNSVTDRQGSIGRSDKDGSVKRSGESRRNKLGDVMVQDVD